MNLCKYKNVLGEPNKGIHSYRLFGLAIADIVMTIVAAFIISYFLKLNFNLKQNKNVDSKYMMMMV